MPFSVPELGIVYEDFVKPTIEQRCNLRVERGDDELGSNVVMEDITKSIRRARLIVADLTGRNANVFYEVGIAHALNKPVLLMTQSIDDVPFDLRHRRALVYEYSPRGCKRLETSLYENVQSILRSVREA
jgi:nucleoside 2-deoxyribosyltransferase